MKRAFVLAVVAMMALAPMVWALSSNPIHDPVTGIMHPASAISVVPHGHITTYWVSDALNQLDAAAATTADVALVQANLTAHESATTSVHGITNTAALETTTGSAAKVSAHNLTTIGVHGIADTSKLATKTYVNGTDEALALTIAGLPTKAYVNGTDEILVADLSVAQGDLTTHEAAILLLESRLGAATLEIAALQSDLADDTAELAHTKLDLAATTAEIAIHSAMLLTHETELLRLETDKADTDEVTHIASDLANTTGEVTDFRADVAADTLELTTNLSDLSVEVGNHTSEITTFHGLTGSNVALKNGGLTQFTPHTFNDLDDTAGVALKSYVNGTDETLTTNLGNHTAATTTAHGGTIENALTLGSSTSTGLQWDNSTKRLTNNGTNNVRVSYADTTGGAGTGVTKIETSTDVTTSPATGTGDVTLTINHATAANTCTTASIALTANTATSATSATSATNSTNATNATNVGVTNDVATSSACYPTFVTTTTGNLPIKTSSTQMTFVPSTGALTTYGTITSDNSTFTTNRATVSSYPTVHYNVTNGIIAVGGTTANGFPSNVAGYSFMCNGKNMAGDAIGSGDYGFGEMRSDRIGLYNRDASLSTNYWAYLFDNTGLAVYANGPVQKFLVTRANGNVDAAGTVTAGAFSGPLTGNVTGNCSGSSGTCTGNAGTATTLATARAIGGVNFDGSAAITPANLSIISSAFSGTTEGILIDGTTAVDLRNKSYQLVYPTSSGYNLAKADATSTMPAVCMNTTSTQSGMATYIQTGFVVNNSWGWTAGALLYVSPTTAGAITATKPTTAGHQVQCVGYAVSDHKIFFNPPLFFYGL